MTLICKPHTVADREQVRAELAEAQVRDLLRQNIDLANQLMMLKMIVAQYDAITGGKQLIGNQN